MNTFPKITTVVQAEPWAEGHVAHITPNRAISTTSRPHHTIISSVLPK